jgi:isoleucyl-tRNA synthetase
LIGNLADFKPAGAEGSNAVAYDDLPSMDKWMLGRLSSVLREVDVALNEYQFSRAINEVIRFSTADLSNFYLDVAKDRLYISSIDDYRRRSCQTVIHACLEGFAKAIAAILPHMAEDIWQNLPYEKSSESVFEGGWPTHLMTYPDHETHTWSLVRSLRDDVNKLLEQARNDKIVGASLEAVAYVYAPDEETRQILSNLEGDQNLIFPPIKTNGVDELRTSLMLSEVNMVNSAEEVSKLCDEKYVSSNTISGCVVGVKKSSGTKCGRCWFYDNQIGKLGLRYDDLCQRCDHAIFSWEKETGNKFTIESSEEQPVA